MIFLSVVVVLIVVVVGLLCWIHEGDFRPFDDAMAW